MQQNNTLGAITLIPSNDSDANPIKSKLKRETTNIAIVPNIPNIKYKYLLILNTQHASLCLFTAKLADSILEITTGSPDTATEYMGKY